MVDGGLIIFKLLVLRSALRGHRDLYAWGMAVTATAISVGLNVHHAEATVTARFMSALPPLSILAAFIAVTRRIEETAVEEGLVAEQASVQANLDKLAAELTEKRRTFDQAMAEMQAAYEGERTRLAAEADTLAGHIAALKRQKADMATDKVVRPVDRNGRSADTAVDNFVRTMDTAVDKSGRSADMTADNFVRPVDRNVRSAASEADTDGQPLSDRQQQILDMLRQDMGQEDIAAALGVSPRTVRRDMGKLNGLVKESMVS